MVTCILREIRSEMRNTKVRQLWMLNIWVMRPTPTQSFIFICWFQICWIFEVAQSQVFIIQLSSVIFWHFSSQTFCPTPWFQSAGVTTIGVTGSWLANHIYTILHLTIVVVVWGFWLITISEVEVINDGTYLAPQSHSSKFARLELSETEVRENMFSSNDCFPLNMKITKLWLHVIKTILTFRYELKPSAWTEKLGHT